MKESDLRKLIQLEASKRGVVLHRNNVGFYVRDGRSIKYGLGVGSSDLVGWSKTGKFIAIELKVGKLKATPEQENFIEQVN